MLETSNCLQNIRWTNPTCACFFFVALCCISHTEAQTERTYCQDTLHFPSNSVGWRNSKPQFASPERRNENIKYFLEDESNPQRVAFTLLQSHSGALRHDSPHVDVDVWRIFIHVVKWLNYEFKITGILLVLRNGWFLLQTFYFLAARCVVHEEEYQGSSEATVKAFHSWLT